MPMMFMVSESTEFDAITLDAAQQDGYVYT